MKATCYALGISLATSIASAQGAVSPGPFGLPSLPYAPQALSPAVDSLTMVIHHDKHHAAYVNNLNGFAKDQPEIARGGIDSLVRHVGKYSVGIRNNAGGHYNHSMFWQIMAPQGQGGQASPELSAQINKDFGSTDSLRSLFNKAASTRFGSGWAWLSWSPSQKKLIVTSTANQDNPLMDITPAAEQGEPILALDVWEHAYYLKYQNRRGDYIGAWWSIVNWNEVNRRFAQATAR